ncbi:MAG: DUF4065 domain-containing protein [Clostridiales Family XIII bacterium]|jgi:uncharacterized phage-associated protein|nr:DUF4065 domain-containing protein [Clostridiales Family XIII bacterium]
MAYSANDIASYILQLSEENGDEITPLKLEKLLYYAQGTFLALKHEALFDDEVLAWKHGPVIYSIYKKYQRYGDSPIPKEGKISGLDEQTEAILSAVYAKYRGFSPWQLVDKTHREAPWKDAGMNDVITSESIRRYFEDEILSTAFHDVPAGEAFPKEWYDSDEDAEWENDLSTGGETDKANRRLA